MGWRLWGLQDGILWWTSACHLRISEKAPWIPGSLLQCLESEQLNSVLTGFGLLSRWSEQELQLLGRNTGGWRLIMACGLINGSGTLPCWELGNPFFSPSSCFYCSPSPARWAALNPCSAWLLAFTNDFFFFFLDFAVLKFHQGCSNFKFWPILCQDNCPSRFITNMCNEFS